MTVQLPLKNTPLLLLITLSILVTPTCPLYPNNPPYKTRQILNYAQTFSPQSNVTLVFTSCGALLDLKQAVLSFFYYNTYPLKKMVLVDRCFTPEIDLRNALPERNQEFVEFFRVVSFGGSQIEGFQRAFDLVDTPYVMNCANKWITYDGMGYIEQAIDAIEYGAKINIKISQVTSLFPAWKNYRSLSGYTKTPSGTKFYQIRSFKPTQRYYFTFNPSLINFNIFYKQIIRGNITQFCEEHRCIGGKMRDCFEIEVGKELHDRNGYVQAWIDDGSVEAKVFLVQR